MKKLLMISVAALACLCVACSNSDDEKNEEKQKQDETPASVELSFTYYATQDMLEPSAVPQHSPATKSACC